MATTPLSPATAEFGSRVRARRHELGESIEQTAHRIDIHWSYLGQVERGLRNISLHNLLKLAAGLHMDPGDLVCGIAPPPGTNTDR